jgi:predicted dehydrogenase
VHARVLGELGATVTAILGSTEASAAATATLLSTSLGIHPRPFASLPSLLAEPLDAVAVCTPVAMHFEHIRHTLDHGLPVFCEKPLLWGPAAADQLTILERHPRRRLFVNTSNVVLLKAVRSRIPEYVRQFSFRFHTQGVYRHREIAIDLMPHGISLLVRLLGEAAIANFEEVSSETTYTCRFDYGACRVDFDFKQGPDVRKQLAFTVNDRPFQRVQEGEGLTYRVSMEDILEGERIAVEDPFKVYLREFIEACRSGVQTDGFAEAALNVRCVARLLTPKEV